MTVYPFNAHLFRYVFVFSFFRYHRHHHLVISVKCSILRWKWKRFTQISFDLNNVNCLTIQVYTTQHRQRNIDFFSSSCNHGNSHSFEDDIVCVCMWQFQWIKKIVFPYMNSKCISNVTRFTFELAEFGTIHWNRTDMHLHLRLYT